MRVERKPQRVSEDLSAKVLDQIRRYKRLGASITISSLALRLSVSRAAISFALRQLADSSRIKIEQVGRQRTYAILEQPTQQKD